MLTLLYKKEFGQPYYETKFVLPVASGPVIAAFLRRVYPSSSPYWQSKLTTTYYDDLALSSYWESRDGLLNKMKYRFRQYFNPQRGGRRLRYRDQAAGRSTGQQDQDPPEVCRYGAFANGRFWQLARPAP